MHRIDGQGAAVAMPAFGVVGPVVGFFTEGNPNTSTPATVVTGDWLNALQEEIINVITGAGLTPTKGTNTQLATAISTGVTSSNDEIVLANNVSNTNVTGYSFDGLLFQAVEVEYSLYRKTATPLEVSAFGKLQLLWKPVLATWELIDPTEVGDDCGVTWNIQQTGNVAQLRYTSTNLAGASYVGEMRLKKNIFKT